MHVSSSPDVKRFVENPASYINSLSSVPNQKQKLRSRNNNTRNSKDLIFILSNLFSNMMMLVCLLLLSVVKDSFQHGYMIDPPSRSSLWRVNKKAPPNYNDNRLYCGGRSVSYRYFFKLQLFLFLFFHIFLLQKIKKKDKFRIQMGLFDCNFTSKFLDFVQFDLFY